MPLTATSQAELSQMTCCELSPPTSEPETMEALATSLPVGLCLGSEAVKARQKLQSKSQTPAMESWRTFTSNATLTHTLDTSSFTPSTSESRSTLSKSIAPGMSLLVKRTTKEATLVMQPVAAASRGRATTRMNPMMVRSLTTPDVPARTMTSAALLTSCRAAMHAERTCQRARARDALALQRLLRIADCTQRAIE